ncbi:MAG: prephenate dehydratase [Thermodesulfobacteriota bacterium]
MSADPMETAARSPETEGASVRLAEIRKELDKLDSHILDLLNQRAALCREVGRLKTESRESVYKPFREKEVLRALIRKNAGVLPDDHLLAIYREILSSSRRLQQPQTIVYLGPEGTFSYFAGVEYLGRSAEFRPCMTLREVFKSVFTREAQLGIIPLENSLQGTVGQCLDLFLEHDVHIQAEVFCKISHALLSPEKSMAVIRRVYSHPQALEQCSNWLRIHLPEASIVPTESTAAAARKVIDADGCAAIGHEKLADMLGLNILSRQIEDLPDNWTRFMIIGAAPPEGGSQDKTSLLFTLPDKSGALVRVLTLLARRNINMKKLESRPLRAEKWQYVFFADVECDLSSDEYGELKRELAENCHSLRILGSYPAGRHLFRV